MRPCRVKRDEAAVSPVIAIILMVAITVVLTGVLYVWVTSMTDTDSDDVSFIKFRAELQDTPPLLTMHMETGDEILWSNYDLFMEHVGNLSSRTQLDPIVNSSTVGDVLKITIDPLIYPDLSIIAYEEYQLQIIHIDNDRIMWEDEVTCHRSS